MKERVSLVFECNLCDYAIPTTDPDAANEIADHLRRKHPRHIDQPGPGERATLRNWIAGAQAVQRKFALNRRSADSGLAVAARLRTALALIEVVEEVMREADARQGNLKHVVHSAVIRERWQRVLDGG